MILIDNTPAKGPHGGEWFHMATDNLAEGGLEELHTMGEALGLRRQWLHHRPGLPHYDIPLEQKLLALRLGATEVSTRELIRRCRRR